MGPARTYRRTEGASDRYFPDTKPPTADSRTGDSLTADPLAADSLRRLLKLLTGAGAILAAGILYGLVFLPAGLAFFCPFEKITGLLCPGCGVSHMCLALFHGDLPGAFRANPLTFTMLPAYAALTLYFCRQYVRQGYLRPARWIDRGLIVLLIAYILFGIGRNLVGT